ncbi:hypothetical protein EYC58_00985 [Candidatus Saccharibacteria bacterium]|nr:MAG: hypothetical protein EYC58_00985 [Candidatus Saccharibacteria bacterium]
MQTLKKMHLTSRTVSWLLMSAISLLLIGAGVGSWLMQGLLASQVTETDHAKIDADLSQTELQRANTLQTYLENNKAAIEKANAVVSETKTYQYQNQIVNDIESYASKAGVTILGYSFPQDTTAAKPDATGLKSVSATLTLQTPVSYVNYLRFLKYIEQNITKMQITSLSLAPDTADANNIKDTAITLKVYVR